MGHVLRLNLLVQKRILLIERIDLSLRLGLRLLLTHKVVTTKLTLRKPAHLRCHRCRGKHKAPRRVQLLRLLC